MVYFTADLEDLSVADLQEMSLKYSKHGNIFFIIGNPNILVRRKITNYFDCLVHFTHAGTFNFFDKTLHSGPVVMCEDVTDGNCICHKPHPKYYSVSHKIHDRPLNIGEIYESIRNPG